MHTPADLMTLLAEWRTLTEREGEAILKDDWKDVAQQQQRKEQLQTVIEAAHKQNGAGENASLNALVAEIMTLETRNRDVLAAKQQDRRAELQRVTENTRNLRSVRRTYGAIPTQRWQSYS